MRKRVFNLSVLTLFVFYLTAIRCPAQQTMQTASQVFPILDGRKLDGLPRKLTARGTISRVDYAPPHCGELIFPTTLEIKLDAELSDYKYPFLYLVVPCLYRVEGAEGLLNKRVEIIATKQEADARRCFFDIKTSKIDSGGLPFYCARREELLQAVAHEPASSVREALEFTGTLEKGTTYRALVKRDRTNEWHTVSRLKLPYHHAGRIEWLNLKDFPELNKPSRGPLLKHFVFKVTEEEVYKVSGQRRWNTTYYCRIVAVE